MISWKAWLLNIAIKLGIKGWNWNIDKAQERKDKREKDAIDFANSRK